MTTPVALTIAGSDPSGSSGLQADLPTLAALGVHATSVITLISAQNSTAIVGFHALAPGQVREQLEALLADMAPMATKTGLLYRPENVELVEASIARLGALVVDPVMVNSAGDLIVDPAMVDAYRDLCGRAAVITPNRREAELLLGASTPLDGPAAIEAEAQPLLALGAPMVVVTGGRGDGPESVDVVVSEGHTQILSRPRIGSRTVRGTGCTLSAAVTAYLARGLQPYMAVVEAQRFVHRQLAASTSIIGTGRQGVTHVFVGE